MSRLKNPDKLGLTGCFIAGGAILSTVTRTEINDYDIYPKNLAGLISIFDVINDIGGTITYISDKAISIKCYNPEPIRIQILTFDWFESAAKIFDLFDFTVCMAAYDCDSHEYVFHDDFFTDLSSKLLRFNPKTKYPLASLVRLKKYNAKGFKANSTQLAAMGLALQNSNIPKSWKELQEQLGGVYGKRIMIQSEDIPYNIENAYQILDSMDLDDSSYLNSYEDEFKYISFDDICNFYKLKENNTPYKLIKFPSLEKSNNKRPYYGLMDSDFFISDHIHKQLIDIYGTPPHITPQNKEFLYGYRVFKVSPTGNMVSCNGHAMYTNKTSLINFIKQFQPSTLYKFFIVTMKIDKLEIYTSSIDNAAILRTYDYSNFDEISNFEVKLDTTEEDDVNALLSQIFETQG